MQEAEMDLFVRAQLIKCDKIFASTAAGVFYMSEL